MLENLKKIDEKKIETILKIAIIVCAFSVYFVWSFSQPYNSAPDEGMKYDICKYVANNNTIPHGGDEAVRNKTWGISYGFMPILSYIISAVFMKIAMCFTRR